MIREIGGKVLGRVRGGREQLKWSLNDEMNPNSDTDECEFRSHALYSNDTSCQLAQCVIECPYQISTPRVFTVDYGRRKQKLTCTERTRWMVT
jgi:hypothetical protein